MVESDEVKDVAVGNQESLQILLRAIGLSQGEFAPFLVRCNYAQLREQILQQLRELSPLKLSELVLDESATKLHRRIQQGIQDEQPEALMVFGIESVAAIDQLVIATNQAREQFLKSFPFPLILWVNDIILQKFIRLAPDFDSWTTIIKFASPREQLVNLIENTAKPVFDKVFEAGTGRFLNSAALNLEIGSTCRAELELAYKDLQNQGVSLEPELEASLEFVLGRTAENSFEVSRQHYERSLELWQQVWPVLGKLQPDEQEVTSSSPSPLTPSQTERIGCTLFCLGLWWGTYAEQNRAKYPEAFGKARSYFQQCIEVFEQHQRPKGVAKFILALALVLQKLEQWDELKKVAQKARELHETYSEQLRLARAYGFLAEVALASSAWSDAYQQAKKALDIVTNFSSEDSANLEFVRSFHGGRYLFILAQAQQHLDQSLAEEAPKSLESARIQTKPQYDPELYLQILEKSRDVYFQQGQYLTAFRFKQERLAVAQQYGFQAFIGANRLRPKQQINNPALPPVNQTPIIAQTIAAVGRKPDVDKLVERFERDDLKLTVIHAPASFGKSSMLQAGLIPTLRDHMIGLRQVLTVVQQTYSQDSVREIGKLLAQALAEKDVILRSSLDQTEQIVKQLQQNQQHNLLTVLIFDQFEEFFTAYPQASDRQKFWNLLQNCLDIPFVKVVLSLRQDYLNHLLEWENSAKLDIINNDILNSDNLYQLSSFSPETAYSVISILTKQAQFYVEDELIEKLVEDLAISSKEVNPLELQLLGSQLQRDNITTREAYQQLDSNPKDQLFQRYLEEVIKDCGSANEEVTRLVLYLLTTEEGTRTIKTSADLEQDFKLRYSASEIENLNLVLEILVGSGLVFLMPDSSTKHYQLAHDCLIPLIRRAP
ncbi:MAG: tetratricopeptide repeat protein [Coleofasciculaceae cyanobacterium]